MIMAGIKSDKNLLFQVLSFIIKGPIILVLMPILVLINDQL